ncbi:MAG: hypothetical protein NZ765_05640 [Anaerolineae bacterium]|nr:hypothetical protein [Anaerolineae bacterium]MDW8071077.1 hypothetical protein [Anaerolineae bacterium]
MEQRMSEINISRAIRSWFWVGMVIIFGLAVLRHHLLADSFWLMYDEGIHLMWVRLIQAGYEPYSEVYITYPPLYHTFLVWAWKVWPSLEGLRWFTLLYSFPSVVFAALISQRIAGTPAALATATLFCLAPQFFENSRSIMGELPSVAWSLMAIWLVLVYRENGSRWLLGLSALALACSLLTKMLSPHIIVLTIGLILSRFFEFSPLPRFRNPYSLRWSVLIRDLAFWAIVFLVFIVAVIGTVDWRALIAQAVEQRISARLISVIDEEYWFDRFDLPGRFINANLWLWPLTQLGLMLSFTHRKNYRFTLVGWLFLSMLMLTFHDPVRLKHTIILMPLMTIWAGISVGEAWAFLRRYRTTTMPEVDWVTSGLVSVLLLAYCLRLPDHVKHWQLGHAIASTGLVDEDARRPMVEFIREITTPDDCLVTDDMTVAYRSGLLIPPELAEVSINRLASGHLSVQQITEITDRYDCQVVAVVGDDRIAKYLPEYIAWLDQNYLGQVEFRKGVLFFVKHTSSIQPGHSVYAQFGSGIRLLGYDLAPTEIEHGNRFVLALFWSALKRTPDDLNIFVHLRDADNTTILTADHQPCKSFVPTSRWPSGGIIKDTTWIEVPRNIPPGRYSIWVGLYRWDTMERLPLQNDTSGENALHLGEITVLPLRNPR